MELRHLRYFVAVAEELSVTRAAARLYISHPALSVQIRQLETEIGAALLIREGRGIKLTEAGRIFLEQARRVLAEANRGVSLVRRAVAGEIGHLSIGYIPVAAVEDFPNIIPAFKKKWPDIHLSFHNLGSQQQFEAVQRGDLDLGFVWLPASPDDFDVQQLRNARFVAVLPARHRLASKSVVSVKELSKEPLFTFPRQLDPDMYHQIEHLFVSSGSAMNVMHELESALSIVSFVAMGLGCSIVPEYARIIRQKGVVYKTLGPAAVTRTLGLVKRKGGAGLAHTFYSFTANSLRSAAP